MELGFNIHIIGNIRWWELVLVVLLLTVYAVVPVSCYFRKEQEQQEKVHAVAGNAAPARNRRNRGRGRG